MRRSLTVVLAASLAAPVGLAGLSLASAAEKAKDTETKISQTLARLPAADREAAEAQRYCAVKQGHRLGSMGAPAKVVVAGQPVFVCCAGCSKKAASDPQATLASVKKLKKIAASLAKLSPDDRKTAEAQAYCAVETENRLGTMGKPVKLLIGGQPVFLCCAGCEDAAKADPEKTLAKAKELKTAK
ncbi:MAG TPA: hypothetical protein VMV10_22690 [Pirellulales bacterium]|nr:hypothetical protein [Pirellulales bacterium]